MVITQDTYIYIYIFYTNAMKKPQTYHILSCIPYIHVFADNNYVLFSCHSDVFALARAGRISVTTVTPSFIALCHLI